MRPGRSRPPCAASRSASAWPGQGVRVPPGAAAGGTVQAKSWDASLAEPASWDLTVNPTKTTAGYLGFVARPSAAAAAYTASYDDITFLAG